MPQFQMLEQSPSFGTELGRQLGSGAAQGLQKSLEQFHEQKKQQALGDQFEAIGEPRELAGLPPQVIKQYMMEKQKRSLMEQYFGQSQEGEDVLHPGESPGSGSDVKPSKEISAKDVEAATLLDPNLGRAKQQERKLQQQEVQQEVQQVKKRNLAVYDKAGEDLKGLKEADEGLAQLESLSKKIGKDQGQSSFERIARSYRFDPETGGFTRFGKVTSTPEEERYIKLIADQTKTIKNDFGARITNLDLQVFLRRFPDLMMTPDGREAIVGTLRDYNEAKQIYNQALRDEISITKGKSDPYELDEIVEKKTGPKLEKIRERIAQRGFSQEDSSIKEEIKITEGRTATDPKTGVQIIFKEGQWHSL